MAMPSLMSQIFYLLMGMHLHPKFEQRSLDICTIKNGLGIAHTMRMCSFLKKKLKVNSPTINNAISLVGLLRP